MTRDELNELSKSWPSCDYYDCSDDTELLSHSEITEALEELLGNVVGNLEEQMRQLWPESLTVYGWTRKTIDLCGLTERAMEAISDEWAEEYANPDVDTVKLPPKLGELLEAAVRTAFEGHPVWSCEQTHEIEIPIDQLVEIAKLEWPEWFEVKPEAAT